MVTLKVFDINGREVQTLVNEQLAPGTYEATFDGSSLSSGTYFYKLTSGDFTQTKRLTLLK
ncbi:MAG: T9SS type A sorting domain-containing protein [Ignavibacteriae bacterium]|nr:T9SS type A sorting domain-containing protein [Ignavibacteriota bacterium]